MRAALQTPITLAVLNLLAERPMHPYEMQRIMHERGHGEVIKMKGGSLYSTIERIAAAGLIAPLATSREGRRPERTVYALTDAGREGLRLWMRELLAQPAQEYPWFTAVLAFLAALPPDEVLALLTHRALRLEGGIAALDIILQSVRESEVPRLYTIEAEYAGAMRRAELAWVRQIVADMQSGALEWPEEVRQAHERAARADS